MTKKIESNHWHGSILTTSILKCIYQCVKSGESEVYKYENACLAN